jgi:hypothetical protein
MSPAVALRKFAGPELARDILGVTHIVMMLPLGIGYSSPLAGDSGFYISR